MSLQISNGGSQLDKNNKDGDRSINLINVKRILTKKWLTLPWSFGWVE